MARALGHVWLATFEGGRNGRQVLHIRFDGGEAGNKEEYTKSQTNWQRGTESHLLFLLAKVWPSPTMRMPDNDVAECPYPEESKWLGSIDVC